MQGIVPCLSCGYFHRTCILIEMRFSHFLTLCLISGLIWAYISKLHVTLPDASLSVSMCSWLLWTREISLALRKSMHLFRSGTGLSFNRRSLVDISVVPITILSLISPLRNASNSQDSESCPSLITYWSTVSVSVWLALWKRNLSWSNSTFFWGVKSCPNFSNTWVESGKRRYLARVSDFVSWDGACRVPRHKITHEWWNLFLPW